MSLGETLATSPSMACASAALAALQSTRIGRRSRVPFASAAHSINVRSAAVIARGQHADVFGQPNRRVARLLRQRIDAALKQGEDVPLPFCFAEFVEIVEEGGVVVGAVPHAVPGDELLWRGLPTPAHAGISAQRPTRNFCTFCAMDTGHTDVGRQAS